MKIPVIVVKENLPEFADENTLCFVVSYSGNTSETIGLYKEAKKKKCQIIVVSSGGELGRVMDDKILVPKGYLPREAFVYLLFPVLNILKINYKDCFEVIKKFDENEVKKIARRLIDKIPVVYCSSEDLGFLCYRWQTFFNENSKAMAHSNFFPELAHNEIEAEVDDEFERILLYDTKTRQIKKANKIMKLVEIKLKGKSLISRIFYGTYFGFLLSYYLAELEGVDYRKAERIRELKG